MESEHGRRIEGLTPTGSTASGLAHDAQSATLTQPAATLQGIPSDAILTFHIGAAVEPTVFEHFGRKNIEMTDEVTRFKNEITLVCFWNENVMCSRIRNYLFNAQRLV